MRTLKNRMSVVGFAIVALLCLTGSSRAFITKPEGSLSGTISFHFYLSPDDQQPSKLKIVEFVVQEQKGEKEWATAWELKGKQALEAITYGAKYENLTETAPARPLSPGVKYRALVSEQAWLRPVGYSTVYFLIDERGVVAVSGPK